MPISDNSPSISYHLQLSTGKQQNETKQNKTKMIETDRPVKVPQRSRRRHATTDPPMTIAIEIITAHAAVTPFFFASEVFNFSIDLFQGPFIFSTKTEGESLGSFH